MDVCQGASTKNDESNRQGKQTFFLTELRKLEKKLVQKILEIQIINGSLTMAISTIATVFTFLIHTLLGLPLKTSDVSSTAL